jgi:hypothetical protein
MRKLKPFVALALAAMLRGVGLTRGAPLLRHK